MTGTTWPRWYGPPQSRRFHLFGEDGRSLCGKWLVLAPNDEVAWDCALGPANGDCAACKRASTAAVSQPGERAAPQEAEEASDKKPSDAGEAEA